MPTVTSASLASGNYELLVLQFDGSNFRVVEATPATATQIGISGNAPGINRWSFPAVSTYAASQSDNGNAVSNYNTPTSSLTVTLPSTTSIGAGWTMGFATDNGKTMTVQVNGAAGEKILIPAGGGVSSNSITLAVGQNYEYATLQFDGSNFRVVAATPQTLNNLGGLISSSSPASSSACTTNQIDARQRVPLHLHRDKHLEARADHRRLLMMPQPVAQEVRSKPCHLPAESGPR